MDSRFAQKASTPQFRGGIRKYWKEYRMNYQTQLTTLLEELLNQFEDDPVSGWQHSRFT